MQHVFDVYVGEVTLKMRFSWKGCRIKTRLVCSLKKIRRGREMVLEVRIERAKGNCVPVYLIILHYLSLYSA